MVHPEVGWEILCGFRRSDVTGPQKNGVVFVDERDEFVWETIALI